MKLEFFGRFSKKSHISNFIKSRLLRAGERTYTQTDDLNEANSRFSQKKIDDATKPKSIISLLFLFAIEAATLTRCIVTHFSSFSGPNFSGHPSYKT